MHWAGERYFVLRLAGHWVSCEEGEGEGEGSGVDFSLGASVAVEDQLASSLTGLAGWGDGLLVGETVMERRLVRVWVHVDVEVAEVVVLVVREVVSVLVRVFVRHTSARLSKCLVGIEGRTVDDLGRVLVNHIECTVRIDWVRVSRSALCVVKACGLMSAISTGGSGRSIRRSMTLPSLPSSA